MTEDKVIGKKVEVGDKNYYVAYSTFSDSLNITARDGEGNLQNIYIEPSTSMPGWSIHGGFEPTPKYVDNLTDAVANAKREAIAMLELHLEAKEKIAKWEANGASGLVKEADYNE